MIDFKSKEASATIVVTLIVFAAWNLFNTLQIVWLKSDFASSTAMILAENEITAQNQRAFDEHLAQLSAIVTNTENRLSSTAQSVDSVISKVGGVEQTVGQITGAVSTLEKLSQTDPELLQKYSRVFFLNEHYAPERLAEIPAEYRYSDERAETIGERVWPFLNNLLVTAKGAGIELYIKSAYRSFEEQRATKSSFTITYGSGSANTFSADQGYSEHQLGTTVDFITTGLNGQLTGFDRTNAYQWLTNNAHRFGFVLSYPANNQYYIFEPWHWRFVGVELATRLFNEGKKFYDLEQREIDTYLTKIFD